MGLTFALSILMRFPTGALGGALLFYLLLTEGFRFLRNKKLFELGGDTTFELDDFDYRELKKANKK